MNIKMRQSIMMVYQWILGIVLKIKTGRVRVPEERAKKKRKRKYSDTWVEGEYHSAKDLFNDLEYQQKWLLGFKPSLSQTGLRAMKKYGVFMHPPADRGMLNLGGLDGGKNRKYPTFLCVAFPAWDCDDKSLIGLNETLMYAERHKWKPGAFNVERPKGDYFYSFGFVIRFSKKEYYPVTTAVEVTSDGEIKILRMRDTDTIEFPPKNGNGRKYKNPVSRQSVRFSKWAAYTLPAPTKLDKAEKPELEKHTMCLFRILYNSNLRRDASTSIHATKGNTRMVFTVPTHSWKDFFKDRVTATASDGKRKRIFHHVATHKRKNGQLVPMHTRGMTRFKWEGFNIKICEWKPGRAGFTEFDLVGEVMSKTEEQKYRKVNPDDRLMGDEETAARLLPHFTKDLHKPTKIAAGI